MKEKILLALLLLVCGLHAKAQINAEQIVRVGQNALYFDDYVLSIQYFNRAIAAKPYLAQPYFYRAVAKLNLEDYRGAETDASACIDRNPFLPEAYEVRGVARQNLGNFRGAVEDYTKAENLLPNNRNLMFNKALALQQLEETDSALTAFNTLIKEHPGYANAYVGRARLMAEKGDTIAAMTDLDKSLELNDKLPNAYIIRASLEMAHPEGYEKAESDISEAIRLEPKEAGLYVNRAFLRYNRDDYFGAMADYDYAISIDPVNYTAIFNRAMLRMESRDNDRAIKDLTTVLELEPEDYRALYNRALLYSETRNYPKALDDINELIARFPELPEALYMRSDVYRAQGKMGLAEADYKKALAMAKALPPEGIKPEGPAPVPGMVAPSDGKDNEKDGSGKKPAQAEQELSAESVARKFAALRTVDNDVDIQQDFVSQGIRGRVQDRDRRIALEPMFSLGYYSASTNTVTDRRSYIKEVDDLNASRMLPFLVMVGNRGLTPSDETLLNRHFQSVENYNKFLAANEPRAIDFFGRAMDYLTLRNYPQAIADLDRAIALTPDFALAYFQRGVAEYDMLKSSEGSKELTDKALPTTAQMEMRRIITDFDRAAELSPRLAFAHYNKANVLVEMGDYTSALAAYHKAIEIRPDFGEAYYNLAYVYFQLGNRAEGAANLSKAGELGVVPSYNLLKRMH